MLEGAATAEKALELCRNGAQPLAAVRCLLVAALTFLGSACTGATSLAPIDLRQVPTAADFPQADAITDRDALEVRFGADEQGLFADSTYVKRYRITRDAGRRYARFSRSYNRGFHEVLDFQSRVVFPNGEQNVLGSKDIRDLSAMEGLYSDSRQITGGHKIIPLGSVVEHRSTIRGRQPQLFSHGFCFGDPLPVHHTSFTVYAPEGWRLAHVAVRDGVTIDWAPSERSEVGSTVWRWERQDLPALEEEAGSPSLSERMSCVSVRLDRWSIGGRQETGFADFDALARYAEELYQDVGSPTPELRREVSAILAGAPEDPREKARRLYEWVQSNVRYVAIEIGLGGWRPHPASEVFSQRYGDCKDMANLLRTMLMEAGIQSHPVWLYSHAGVPRPLLQPVLGETNHEILAIDLPGGRVFADPTEATVPFGELPLRDQEAPAFVQMSGRGELVIIPASTAEENATQVTLELALADRGASGRFELMASGAPASELSLELRLKKDDERREAIKRAIGLTRGTIRGEKVQEAKREGRRVLLVEGTLELDQLGLVADGSVLLRPRDLWALAPKRLPDRPRTAPHVSKGRALLRVALRLALPEGAVVETLPAAYSKESSLGSHLLKWTQSSGVLELSEQLRRDARIVPPERVPELSQFLQTIREAEASGVVVRLRSAS